MLKKVQPELKREELEEFVDKATKERFVYIYQGIAQLYCCVDREQFNAVRLFAHRHPEYELTFGFAGNDTRYKFSEADTPENNFAANIFTKGVNLNLKVLKECRSSRMNCQNGADEYTEQDKKIIEHLRAIVRAVSSTCTFYIGQVFNVDGLVFSIKDACDAFQRLVNTFDTNGDIHNPMELHIFASGDCYVDAFVVSFIEKPKGAGEYDTILSLEPFYNKLGYLKSFIESDEKIRENFINDCKSFQEAGMIYDIGGKR